jgi:hypothetical protein
MRFVAGFFAGVISALGIARWLEDANRGSTQQTLSNPRGWDSGRIPPSPRRR